MLNKYFNKAEMIEALVLSWPCRCKEDLINISLKETKIDFNCTFEYLLEEGTENILNEVVEYIKECIESEICIC